MDIKRITERLRAKAKSLLQEFDDQQDSDEPDTEEMAALEHDWRAMNKAADLIERQAAEIDRLRADAERVIDAIDAEPELPGDMPPEMAAAMATAMINEDADFFIHALRLAVRMTKEGIRNRVVAARGGDVYSMRGNRQPCRHRHQTDR